MRSWASLNERFCSLVLIFGPNTRQSGKRWSRERNMTKVYYEQKKQNTRWERGLETPFNGVPTLGTLAPGRLDDLPSVILCQEAYEVLLVICPCFLWRFSFWISLYSGLLLLVLKRGMVAFNEQGHLCGSRDGWRGAGHGAVESMKGRRQPIDCL